MGMRREVSIWEYELILDRIGNISISMEATSLRRRGREIFCNK